MKFIFILVRQKELIMFTSKGFAADNIRRSTIHITLGINNRVGKDFIIKINILWLECLSLIVDKISMINFKAFNINRQMTAQNKKIRYIFNINFSRFAFGSIDKKFLSIYFCYRKNSMK